jgi:hypothetical protein
MRFVFYIVTAATLLNLIPSGAICEPVALAGKKVANLDEMTALIKAATKHGESRDIGFEISGDLEWPLSKTSTKLFCGSPVQWGDHVSEDSIEVVSKGDGHLSITRCFTEAEFPNCYEFEGIDNGVSQNHVLQFKRHFKRQAETWVRYSGGALAFQFIRLKKTKTLIIQARGLLDGEEIRKDDMTKPFTGQWPSKWIKGDDGLIWGLEKIELSCSPKK